MNFVSYRTLALTLMMNGTLGSERNPQCIAHAMKCSKRKQREKKSDKLTHERAQHTCTYTHSHLHLHLHLHSEIYDSK